MKKIFLLVFTLIALSCHQPNFESKDSIRVIEKDKAKAMDYWKKAKSGWQFSDYHRIHYDSALLFYPDSSEMFQRFSYSYKKTGEHIKAMQLLNTAVELDPKEALGYRAWSMLYYYRNYKKTIEDIDSLLSMTKSCMEVCWGEPCKYHRFLALYKLDKYEEALIEIADLKQCEKNYGLTPEDEYNYNFYIARCYQKLQQYDKALQYYDRLFEDSSGVLAEYFYYKGTIHLALKENETACSLFEKALNQIKKDNKFSDPYVELFDEVYLWMIEEVIKDYCPISISSTNIQK